MDATLMTILKWVAIIIIVLICGWFILEVIDRIDDDNPGYIDLGRFITGVIG